MASSLTVLAFIVMTLLLNADRILSQRGVVSAIVANQVIRRMDSTCSGARRSLSQIEGVVAADVADESVDRDVYAFSGPTRNLKQFRADFSQRSGIPTSNPTASGSSNTANYFSSGPGDTRRIGAIGYGSAITGAGSFSAADTTVIAGNRGTDGMSSGSGAGIGPGSGSIGDYRGYSSAGGRKLNQVPVAATTLTNLQNPDAGNNGRGAISQAAPSDPAAALGQARAQGTGRRSLLQRSSVATLQPTRAGTSTALLGADFSATSQERADIDSQIYGTGSGSTGIQGVLNTANGS